MLTIYVFALLVFLLVINVPVVVAIAMTAISFIVYTGQMRGLNIMPQRMYVGTTGFTLIAIPFFIFAGNLMNMGGITERIFRFAKALVGHVPGGLGQVNIVASVIFSGMSGSAVADAAGLGQIEHKAMVDDGYDPAVSATLVAASSIIGPVIPPSIPFVLYGAITSVSVGPANRSMPTRPNSWRFASATKAFPGPTSISTGARESVPNAIAPIA